MRATLIDSGRVMRHARLLNRRSEMALPEDERRGVFRAAVGWLGEPLRDGDADVGVLVAAERERQRQVNRACASVLAALVVAILAIGVLL